MLKKFTECFSSLDYPGMLNSMDRRMGNVMSSVTDDFYSLFGGSSILGVWKQVEKGYELRLEIPGYTKEELSIEIHPETETLMVEGKKKDQSDRYASQSTFRSSYSLPFGTKLETVAASVQNGVCLISVQTEKKEVQPRTISVSIS